MCSRLASKNVGRRSSAARTCLAKPGPIPSGPYSSCFGKPPSPPVSKNDPNAEATVSPLHRYLLHV
eukprot:1061978-Amphidinium_carterae.1